MKFLWINIQNFMAIKDATVSLADRGLVLIEGVNDTDAAAVSNGSGKSTIADALAWVLFGVTARGVKGDAILNRDEKKNTLVCVAAQDGDDVYHVIRHRKHKIGKNRLEVYKTTGSNGQQTDLTCGTDKLTQELAENIIGCSYDVFRASVYSAQNQTPDLPALTDKLLKTLVEEAAGISVLARCSEIARERLRAAQQDHVDALRNVDAQENSLASLRQHKKHVKNDRQKFEDGRKRELDRLLASSRDARDRLENDYHSLTEIDRRLLRCEKRIRECDQIIANYASEQVRLDHLKQACNDADSERTRAQSELDRVIRDLSTVDQRLGSLSAQVGQPCSECGRKHTADTLAEARAVLERDRALVVQQYDDASDALDRAHKAFQSACEQRDSFLASMTNLDSTNAQRAKYTRAIQKLRNERDKVVDIEAKIQSLADEYKRLLHQRNPHDGPLARLDQSIAEEIDSLNEAKKELEIVEKRASTLDVVANDIYGLKGVRARILDDVTPFLNERTAHYLGALTDGVISATWTTLVENSKGELREKFSIEVEGADGQAYEGLSGGEQRKVRIATALALQDLIARRATKPIDLFIADEIDDALDVAGQERLIELLEERALERGTVFIISHAELKDQISNVMRVVKRQGVASVEDA